MFLEDKINLQGEESYYMKLIGFFLGIVVLGIFCYIDDVKGLPAIVKLIGQVIAAIIVRIDASICKVHFFFCLDVLLEL